MSPREKLEVIHALHLPGVDGSTDTWVHLCESAIEKKPDDAMTAELLDSTIQHLVNLRDQAEIQAQLALMTSEQREIFEILTQMGDDQIAELAGVMQQHRE